MKKSQILAALALAFALGVVAPVAGVANVSATANASQTQDINTAINGLKKSFKTVKTYAAAGGTATENEGATAYGLYVTDAANVKRATDFIANMEKATSPALTTIRGNVRTALGMYAVANPDIAAALASANKWTSADLATVKNTVANDILPALAAAKAAAPTAAAEDAIQLIIEAVTDAVSNQKVADAKDAAATAAVAAGGALNAANVPGLYVKYTGKDAPAAVEALSDLTTMVNGIVAALPDMALYEETKDEIATLEGLRDGLATPSNQAVNKAIADLKKAAGAATTPADKPDDKPADKPEGPTDNGDEGDKTDAPNTGALLSSDKGATTVSIVAGLATALTALGAGVVAYRNARRSSK